MVLMSIHKPLDYIPLSRAILDLLEEDYALKKSALDFEASALNVRKKCEQITFKAAVSMAHGCSA